MAKALNRLVLLAVTAVTAAAIAEQLRRPPEERTWQGDVMGVPYDFRKPSFDRFVKAWWNPEDSRLFTPRDFGVGWSINLCRAYSLLAEARQERQEP